MSLIESSRIPFAAEVVRGERLLVLAPHPDDEVIACGGLLAQHVDDKRKVQVVVVTDGSAAEVPGTEGTHLRASRESESIAGLEVLGISEPRFLRFVDRSLGSAGEPLESAIREAILTFQPDLILVPSPVEIHPDHAALARAFVSLIQSSPDLAPPLAVCTILFYEVSQPIRPNVLVDITAVADRKFEAIAAHKSQHEIKDYHAFAKGLNRYRAMTLPGQALYAEGYWRTDVRELRSIPWSELGRRVSGAPLAEVVQQAQPITVVIRTLNRHKWLSEALDSVAATGYPADVIVVNDGGASPSSLTASRARVQLIDLGSSQGRSAAMNAGVAKASTNLISFLDDDDLFYPEHLETLSTAAQSGSHAAYYTDAISAFYEMTAEGNYRLRDRLRLFAQPFDRELLLFDNFIPLPTLLVRKSDYLAIGGFDTAFDLFEDWDFLIRLSRLGNFLRVPRLTCEIRHFAGSDSILSSSPEGSERFQKARLAVWRKHSSLMTPELTSSVFEKQKKRVLQLEAQAVETGGREAHLRTDLARFEREKELLIEQLRGEFEQKIEAIRRADVIRGELEGAHHQIGALTAERDALTAERVALARYVEELRTVLADRDRDIGARIAEIERLNAMLSQIYQSKSWKLHELIEKARGRVG